MKSFELARTHLWRKKISTLIALIGIAMSVATSGVLLRVFLLSKERFASLAQTGDAIVGAKGNDIGILLTALNLEGPYPDFVPAVLYQSLAGNQTVHFEDGFSTGISPIETAIPFVIFAQVKNHRVLATNELFTQTNYPTLPKFAQGHWPTGPHEVILGSQTAESLQGVLGQNLVGQVWIDKDSKYHEDTSFKIVGILKATGKAWDRGIYSNLETAHAVFESHQADLKSIWKDKLLHYFLIYLRSDEKHSSQASISGMTWLKTLINQRTVAQTISVSEEIKQLEELTGTQQELGIFVSLIIVFLGALSTATMMITRFEAMTLQLAILRAVGYAKKELYWLLFWEASLIGLIACSLGALLDGLTFPWVRELLGNSLPSAEIVSMGLLNSWPVWFTAFIGSLLSILIPLIRLQRQNIHWSLRNIN